MPSCPLGDWVANQGAGYGSSCPLSLFQVYSTLRNDLSCKILLNNVDFSARCSSFVKLSSAIEADCTVEAILLLMLSLEDSDKSR